MKRELLNVTRTAGCPCCPGCDKFPADTYASRRSKRARSKGKQREHQYVRSLRKRELRKELLEDQQEVERANEYSTLEKLWDLVLPQDFFGSLTRANCLEYGITLSRDWEHELGYEDFYPLEP